MEGPDPGLPLYSRRFDAFGGRVDRNGTWTSREFGEFVEVFLVRREKVEKSAVEGVSPSPVTSQLLCTYIILAVESRFLFYSESKGNFLFLNQAQALDQIYTTCTKYLQAYKDKKNLFFWLGNRYLENL